MSWQTYVDEHLMCDIDGRTLSHGGIVGHDGSLWAASSGFWFEVQEIKAIMELFENPDESSFCLSGQEYTQKQSEPGSVLRGIAGDTNAIIKKSQHALIIGISTEMTPSQINMVVERLCDYMIDQGL